MTGAQPHDSPDIEAARAMLVRFGLAAPDEHPKFERLTGGVASDIWRVDLAHGPVCVKRALARLRVAQEWLAPVERNANEVAWLETAARIVPEAAPRVLAADPAANLFAMEYLDPRHYDVWKSRLRDGVAKVDTACAVADRLARIHAGTAGKLDIAARFATDSIFYAIRLDPYLVSTARRYEDADPDVAAVLRQLAATTATTKKTLVHGDVSPKNILVGPRGPVFLDAECAWYGDPAFDLAFCLNHLLLKCLWTPRATRRYLACFDELATTYLTGVTWERADEIETRTAHLLPGLFLGRVDGKSPVEYLTDELNKNRVRRVACALLHDPVARLADVRHAWGDELS